MPGFITITLGSEPSSDRRVTPVLVALGSIPRKYFVMSDAPELGLTISTGKSAKLADTYYITVEVSTSANIVPEVFIMARTDPAVNSYSYSRVASPSDFSKYGSSPYTDLDGYRTSSFTITSNSPEFIKQLRDGVPKAVQALLDDYKESIDTVEVNTVTTLKLVGGQ